MEITSIDRLFAGVLGTADDYVERRRAFLKEFSTDSLFINEYKVFSLLFSDIVRLKITPEYISAFLGFQRANLENDKSIELSNYGVSDNTDAYTEFSAFTVEKLKELQGITITTEDWMTAKEVVKMNYLNAELLKTLETGAEVLTSGKKIGNKTISGFSGSLSFVNQQLTKLDAIANRRGGGGFISTREMTEEEAAEELNPICGWGLPTLDENIGLIRETRMIGINAPTKGGKSRFSAFIQHNAHVNGVTTAIWSKENAQKGYEALLRARHFDYLYNQNTTDIGKRNLISDSMIVEKTLSPEMASMEEASWLDYRHNSNYGETIFFKDDNNLTIEDLIPTLDSLKDKYPDLKILVIDYLQLLSSRKGGRSSEEIISEGYQLTLAWLKKNKVAGIFPAQYKQETINNLGKLDPKDVQAMEMRTAASKSHEVLKAPDILLGLYGTQEMIDRGELIFLPMLSRVFAPFPAFGLDVDFGSCTFVQSQSF